MSIIKTFFTIFLISVLCGCCPNLDKDKIKNEISKDLKIGDSREKVESVLKSHGIAVRYDEYQQRYYSGIGGEDCAFNPFNKVVDVGVYIDNSGLVSKIETSYSYTFL